MFYLTTHEHLTHGKITFSAGASNPTEGLVGVVVTFSDFYSTGTVPTIFRNGRV
jgi:hypothetical protein